MTLVSKRLPVLLAVLIGAAMAFAAWGLLPSTAYAEDEGSIDRICFDGDYKYDWAHFYYIDGQSAVLNDDDLAITVLDEDKTPIDPDKYDLVIEHTWYNDEQHADQYEEVETPLGLADADKTAEGGFTEYVVTATAKEGSGYEGEANGTFVVADKYSLNYYCSDVDFPAAPKKTGWAMHNWFWFWAGQTIAPTVTAQSGDGDELTPDTQFSVTYHQAKDSIDSLTPMDELFVDEGTAESPGDPGDYFAVVKGIAPYYGESITPIRVQSISTIYFIAADDYDLWSDRDKEYILVASGDYLKGDVQVTLKVQTGESTWMDIPESDEYYKYNPDNYVLTLHGDTIIDVFGCDRNLEIHAEVKENGNCVADGYENVWLREAYYNYNWPNDHEELLPGWNEWIDGSIHVQFRNAQWPEEHGQDLKVTDVALVDPEPEDVLTLEKKDDGWDYHANKSGSATHRLTYRDIDGAEKTYDIHVNVSDTVYVVNLWSEENIYTGFPEDEIVLFAWGEKKWIVQDGGNPDNWHEEGTSDNLAYKWELIEGADFATLNQDKNEPYRAVLKFKPMPAGWDSIGERVKVKVSIREDSDDVNTERAANDNEFWVSDDFYQIYPTTIDSNLLLGETIELKPELRHYQLGKDYSVVDNVKFDLNNYDDNAIEVGGENGTFTIKRLQQWDTNFCVEARWGDKGWRDQWYHLNGKHYRAEFGFGDVDVYDDYHVTLTPEIQDGEDLSADDYEITYRLGRFEWNEENEAYDAEFEVDADSGVYKVNGNSITIYGDKLAALGRDNLDELRIIAHLKINGIDCEDTDCWINSRESCKTWGQEHNWIKSVVKKPTIAEVGYEFWICPDYMFLNGCGEMRLVEIPKLINLAGATVAKVSDKAYTGKAQTPALTVKCNGTALKAGTDYTVKFTNNIKVGKATATLTGKGKYGGTKKATFNIVKAKNPMVVTTKAVTLKAKDVKKKDQTVKTTAAFAVTKNQGKVTYTRKSGDKKITIASNGTITVKKGLKKGKYKFVVNVKAAGNANYKPLTKAATVNITVK